MSYMQNPRFPTILTQPRSEAGLLCPDPQFLQEILPFSIPVHYPKGEAIVIEGTDSSCLYYVQKGSVEVSSTVRGTKIVVALIGTGNFFGEIGFIDGISRVQDIRAAEETVIRVFEQERLLKVQNENPLLYAKFVTFVAHAICAKFRRVLEEQEPLAAYAASLSTGRRSFQESKPLPRWFFRTPEWHFIHKSVEKTKASFFNLSHQLQQDARSEIPFALQESCSAILDGFNESLQEFKEHNKKPEMEEYVWGYIFKEIFPYYMRSRFAERAYYKPKGYAGDFNIMEMIYRNQPDGDGKLGTLVDRWCLNTMAAKAVRGRRKFLTRQLETLTHPKLATRDSIRIMNLACGSCRELFDFLSLCHHTEMIEAFCVDIDPQALEYTNNQVNAFSHRASIRLMSDNVIWWALGGGRLDYDLQDIIYTAGLADYLNRRLFQALVNRCHEHLKPGGVLIVGNFGPQNPNRVFMDHILNWKLFYRDSAELQGLFAGTPFGNRVEVLAEEQGVNLFAIARKSE